MYVKIESAVETTMKSMYDIIWGQCSDTLRSRLGGHDDYATYSLNADSIALLKGICAEMTGFRSKQYLPHALHKIMGEFYNLTQGKQRNNQEYDNEFNSMQFTAAESGATIGAHPAAVTEETNNSAADPQNPTLEEYAPAMKIATSRYLAVAFLLGADKMRYGTLIEEIENQHLQDKFSSDGPVECTEYDKKGSVWTTHKSTIFLQANSGNPSTWYLLDNQSTCGIISDPRLVTYIRQVEGHMQLSTRAGSTTTNWMADVPGYYRPVWFHPGGIANILYLVNMIAKYHVTYDSRAGDSPNAFCVHKPDGGTRRFKQSRRGLYYLDTAKTENHTLLAVSTV
jgi:hypothetical protein